ncbi:MAG: hypothetical protein WA876_04270 [Candidatus Acidiferrales bacterium]
MISVDPPRDENSGSSSEEQIIKAFILKPRRSRYLSLVSSRKGRAKFLQSLAHNLELNPSCTHPLAKGTQTPEQVFTLLRDIGAPAKCYVISEELDGVIIDLRKALDKVIGSGIGSIIYCSPNLAFYEAEEPSSRFLLRCPHK